MYLVVEGAEAGKEPIGNRIIETPISASDTEFLRAQQMNQPDSHASDR